ncbi:MAG: Arm DNA-binding domain-containing protein, partial [Actinomycetota bacterium]|nr:Arm DNA-binding domain-containing protein [Actinomycetota bacterium]
MKGSVYKRCSCPVERDARGGRKACKLRHGSWTFVADVPGVGGKRRQVKRSGFPTKAAAEAALASVADEAASGHVAHDDGQRLSAFLDAWLAAKVADGLRASTARSYRQHINDYIGPQLGHLRLRAVRPTHVEAVLRTIATPAPERRALGPTTVRRVHATLRSALSSAKRKRLITHNPAVDVDLPKAPRPKVRPWEPADLGAFLDFAAGDRLGPLFEL